MAVTFPVSVADFFGKLHVAALALEPTDAVQVSRTRGGEVLSADVGAVLWRGSARLTPEYYDDMDGLRALLMLIRRPGGSFMVSPPYRRGPIADPNGAILGASTPQIHSLEGNNRELRIKGLPPGYVLSAGDYLSFEYGTNPLRYAFHQIVTGAAADGSGVTGQLEVFPVLRPGVVLDTPVKLVAPEFRAVIEETPEYGRMADLATNEVSFSFIQTLGGP